MRTQREWISQINMTLPFSLDPDSTCSADTPPATIGVALSPARCETSLPAPIIACELFCSFSLKSPTLLSVHLPSHLRYPLYPARLRNDAAWITLRLYRLLLNSFRINLQSPVYQIKQARDVACTEQLISKVVLKAASRSLLHSLNT